VFFRWLSNLKTSRSSAAAACRGCLFGNYSLSSITEHSSHGHHVTSSHRRKSVTHVFSTICRLCAESLALSNLPVSAFAISLLASGAKLHKRFKLEILED
jgi:hypothetical protein